MTRALLVAAPHSGTGKTTFCAGLAACLRQRGIRVRCCKVGPDYLDPSWLTLASDRPCINLDLWLHGETSVRRRFQEACRDVDVCLVEGVMGLYDGLQAKEDTGSSAHVARLLGIPVLLLADASGCARSFAALVHGFTSFPQAPSFCGVIANRIGSPRHRRILQDALDSQSALPPLLGTLPQQGMPTLESRHLGLVSARNQNEAQSILDALAGIVAQHVSVDKLLSQAGDIPSSPPVLATPITSPHCRIALACDEAFHFYYSGLEAALQERGCEVARYSPQHED
ncbi:MAG TPA: cobyrinate a,c-diamide synthase, partial [Fibrobacteraceae bacterium]|nr:cobyrinate a,c-diamide synthase [Fibrobacteraceae bacterium]